MMEHERGAIHYLQSYLRGKMLDHSGWARILPRNITPSDVDMVLDNDGKLLFVELKANTAYWHGISIGQRKLYENIVRMGQGKAIAVLAQHTDNSPIDTTRDIQNFSLMLWRNGEIKCSPVYEGKHWITFVKAWFGGLQL